MKQIKGLRWWIIGLICLGTIINYLARNSLAVLAPELQKKLQFSTQEYSYIVAAFQIGYTVMQSVCGFILDFLGLQLGFALFALAWSLFNVLHAFAGGWGSLAFFRGLLGLSEASAIPAGIKAISEWFPAKERSVAVGYFNAGTSLGALLAPPLVVWVLLQSSWQMAFVVTGCLGFIWAGLWWVFYRSPSKHKSLTEGERAYILQGQEPDKIASAGERKPPSVKKILSSRRFWGIALPRFLAEPAWQTFNFWIPLYLATVRHMDIKEIAIFAWLPFLAADLGGIFVVIPPARSEILLSRHGYRRSVIDNELRFFAGQCCFVDAKMPAIDGAGEKVLLGVKPGRIPGVHLSRRNPMSFAAVDVKEEDAWRRSVPRFDLPFLIQVGIYEECLAIIGRHNAVVAIHVGIWQCVGDFPLC